jgi:hypothetical protein
MLWKFEGKCLYSCSWGDTVNFRNREVGTRAKRGMAVFVLKVNFLRSWLCKLLYEANAGKCLKFGYNLLLSTSFPVGHYRNCGVWHCLVLV